MDVIFMLKQFVVGWTSLDRDALHIYVAVAVFLGSCAVLGWKAYHWKPLLLVFIVALIGEAFDLRHNWQVEDNLYVMSSVHDLSNTILVPLIIFTFAKLTRVFSEPEAPEESGDELEV